MVKYHMSEDGVPRRCTAKPGSCPLGDEDNHYSSIETAQRAYESYASDSLGTFTRELPFPLGDRQLLDSLAYLEASQDLTFARHLHREMRVALQRVGAGKDEFTKSQLPLIRTLMDDSNAYPEWRGAESLERLRRFHELGSSFFREADRVEEENPALARKLRSYGRGIQGSVQKLTPVDKHLAKKEQLNGVSYIPVTEGTKDGEN